MRLRLPYIFRTEADHFIPVSTSHVDVATLSLESLRDILGASLDVVGEDATLDVNRAGEGPRVILSLFRVNDRLLLSAQTAHGYFELHDVEGFVIVEPDEVIFFGGSGSSLSGLLIGRSGSCSLFANVDRALLETEPVDLAPAQMLAAMQLGLVTLRPAGE